MRISYWTSDVCSSYLLPGSVTSPSRLSREENPRVVAGSRKPDLYAVGLPIRFRRAANRVGRTRHGFSSGRQGKRRWRRRPTARPCLGRSEEHTSELQSLMRISYAVFCLKKTTHRSYI